MGMRKDRVVLIEYWPEQADLGDVQEGLATIAGSAGNSRARSAIGPSGKSDNTSSSRSEALASWLAHNARAGRTMLVSGSRVKKPDMGR